VSQVERGVRKVDRMSVLESLADALEVPLAELAAEAPVVAALTEELPAARGLRLVLSGAYSLSGMLVDRRPPAITTLRDQVREGWDLVHAAKYAELSELLRSLVPDLESAALEGPRDPASGGIRVAGHRLPGMLRCARQARRTRGSLDRR